LMLHNKGIPTNGIRRQPLWLSLTILYQILLQLPLPKQ
jgi:hypothetical protein